MFQRFAADLACLSTCKRLKVGAVLVPMDLSRVLAIGYNGPPADCPNDGCRADSPGNCGCVHAEANALIKASWGESREHVLLLTDSPCEHCAGLILNTRRIVWVVYERAYRDTAGVDKLRGAGIKCVHLPLP